MVNLWNIETHVCIFILRLTVTWILTMTININMVSKISALGAHRSVSREYWVLMGLFYKEFGLMFSQNRQTDSKFKIPVTTIRISTRRRWSRQGSIRSNNTWTIQEYIICIRRGEIQSLVNVNLIAWLMHNYIWIPKNHDTVQLLTQLNGRWTRTFHNFILKPDDVS